MIARALASCFVLGLAASFVACNDDGGDVGAPCNEDADCSSELICDVHEGQGSCQEPHDHGHEHDEDSGTDSSTGS